MTETPFDWKPTAGKMLESALNRALALDPDTSAALAALNGRSVELSLHAPTLALRIFVDDQRLHVGPIDAAQTPDLALHSTLGGLLSQVSAFFGKNDDINAKRAPSFALPVGRMRVTGDAELARYLQSVVARFDPDWKKPLTSVFGDVIGVQIANTFAAALRHAQNTASSLTQSAVEYVTEESRDVVGRYELNAFHDEVDVLRDDTERLAARLARLQSRDVAV